MDEATQLGEFLPISFKTPSEQEYITFLWNAFETNYTNGKYQFAFLAYHMLTMSVIYFNIWQIRRALPDDFRKGLIGFGRDIEKSMLGASSPFVFSSVNERTIMRFFRLIGCDDGMVGAYAKLVDDRNQTAHPNGQIIYSTQTGLDTKLAEVLRALEEIEAHSRCVIEELYREFLLHNADPEEREYTDVDDQIREVLVHANYLSQRDIQVCLDYDVPSLASAPHYDGILELHEALKATYGQED